MPDPRRLAFASLLAASALAGCVPQGDFPSLAVRPAERDRSMEPPVREPVAVADDPSLRARIVELERQAAEGDRAFDRAFPAAEAAVARAGPSGSDSWVEAQLAVSRVEAARNDTMRALTELDRLAIERADSATSQADFAAIDSAIASAQALAEAQLERLGQLKARLPAVD